MPLFSRESLYYFLEDALKAYSEDFIIVDTNNPVIFSLNKVWYSAHISYVHDSGENRDNDDEARIQIQRATLDRQINNYRAGYKPLFLGFFNIGDVFTGWDFHHVLAMQFKTIGSVYSRKSHAIEAREFGGTIRRFRSDSLKRNVSTITLKSELLGVYIENIELFHQIETSDELRHITNSFPELSSENNHYREEKVEVELNLKGERKKLEIISSRIAYPRSRKFSESVLAAYDYSCAICRKQLGIVEAAHIVPHSHDASTDSVTNGIALCVEHHKYYDSALLMPNTGNRLFVNHEKIQFLREINRSNGIDNILALEQKPYGLPTSQEYHPNEKYIELGIKIRLGRSV